ncbi:type-F conjugative transfer system protein TrbI [Erwinia aphidicola]|uniref:type-F conjugative transfer system protein TrbI n=1 Tax=Erwinia aphidicola TaxID=68334 RepID=UPI000789DAA1
MSEKNNGRAVLPGATARGRARFRSTKQKPHGKAPAPGRLAVIAGASLLLMACCAGGSALVVQHMQRGTVVFDMKNTIDTFKQQSAQKELDENTARVMTERFSRALNDSLSAYMSTHNDLILVPGAVVQPVLDITPEIQSDIARRMQEGP